MEKRKLSKTSIHHQRVMVVALVLMMLVALSVLVGVPGLMQAVHAGPVVPRLNNGLARTPWMGWSSWSTIRYYPSEAKIEAQAQAMASTLKSYGYVYVKLPPPFREGLVSGLHRNSEYLLRRPALASLSDTSGTFDNSPVLPDHERSQGHISCPH